MSYEVHPIGWIIDSGYSPELLEQRLRKFCCARDQQLERFIQNRAIFFETKGLSRTYLVFDTTAAGSGKVPPIAAFFTKALVDSYRQNGYALLTDVPGSGGYFKMYKILPDKVSLLSGQ
jgi:hypothetical protein